MAKLNAALESKSTSLQNHIFLGTFGTIAIGKCPPLKPAKKCGFGMGTELPRQHLAVKQRGRQL